MKFPTEELDKVTKETRNLHPSKCMWCCRKRNLGDIRKSELKYYQQTKGKTRRSSRATQTYTHFMAWALKEKVDPTYMERISEEEFMLIKPMLVVEKSPYETR